MAVGVHIVAANPRLARVLHTAQKVLDVLLLACNAFLHLHGVGDVLLHADALPVGALNLNLILHACSVAQFGALAGAYEAFLVVGAAAKHGTPVGHGVVLCPRCGETHHHGKLACACRGAACGLVCVGVDGHAAAQVAVGVGEREQLNALHTVDALLPVLPVGVVKVVDASAAVGLLEAAVARLLVHKAVDAPPVA